MLELVALGRTPELRWWFDNLKVLESTPKGETCAGEADSRARLIALLEGEVENKPGDMYRAVEDLRRWATNCSATLSAARLNQTRSWVDRGRSWLASVKRKALFLKLKELYVLVTGLRLSSSYRRLWKNFPSSVLPSEKI